MTVHTIDPLQDMRWNEFLTIHPRASVFHTPAWIEAVRRTYGYQPVVLTSSPPGQPLRDGLLFCCVKSWLTGRRLVSFPFSDHCAPLLDDGDAGDALFASLLEHSRRQRCAYVELRPVEPLDRHAPHSDQSFCLHRLDLAPDVDALFRNLHKDSTQRKVRRAEHEGLRYEEGQSAALLDDFYPLLRLARRRHGVPPQPPQWFHNLVQCFGESLKIRVAYREKQPIAAMITLCHKDTLVYKFGGSDAAYHNLGGVQFLFWKAIVEAKQKGLQCLDLGRSDPQDHGLITFKDRLGASRSTLTYSRYFSAARTSARPRFSGADWKYRLARRVFAHVPNSCLSAVGTLLYRHIG